jgi:hypothetical protein
MQDGLNMRPILIDNVLVKGIVTTLREEPDGWKICVRDSYGYKVWGVRPEFMPDIKRGEEISFLAEVRARGGRDPKFGFFSNPRQLKKRKRR